MRQLFGEIGWEKKVLVFFAALTILTVLGPFGTYEDLDIWARTVFWTAIVGGVGFFMHVTMTVALNTKNIELRNRFIRLAIGAILGGLPGAAVVVFVNQVFRPLTVTPDALPYIWMQVSLIGYVIGCVEYVDWGLTTQKETAPVRAKFHDRLSEDVGRDVISLTMNDHYVEVTTSLGKQLILLRLSDAIAELEGVSGQRVHRSHWIALAHVRGIQKVGSGRVVALSDGRTIPVSETYANSLSEKIAH